MFGNVAFVPSKAPTMRTPLPRRVGARKLTCANVELLISPFSIVFPPFILAYNQVIGILSVVKC